MLEIARRRHALGIPVTPRGTGTGNYGQAMPLSGGVMLDLAGFNKVIDIAPGRYVAEPGAIMARIDEQTRAAFAPGTAPASLDLPDRLDRRLHRWRLGRRRLDQMGRPARLGQHHPAQGRDDGGQPAHPRI